MYILEKDGAIMSVALEVQRDAFLQNGWVEKSAQPTVSVDVEDKPKRGRKKAE